MRAGPYRVLSELGHGGMGTVYLAVRDEPSFTQKVALKLIKRGMDTDEIVRRFVAERQILASLAHPNIARLFDGGSTPEGRPYFVMEYVEGQPITAYSAERKLSVEARLRLFLRVCRAVQHAHQSLVVHRDLKPANILVDAEGEPKLLDFGIAKLLDPSSFGGLTALTGLAPGPMTPDYASPEQRVGGPITTATDVYGLGLLLYELLVGQNPRAVERKLGEGWAERPPSQAIVALAGPKDAEARRLARQISGDLDTIVGKALESEPQRRYGTAAALAEDVERHLTQRPVTARRPTPGYRLSRAVVRNKLAATLILGVYLLAGTSAYFARTIEKERGQFEAQRRIVQALNSLQLRMIQRPDPEEDYGETLTAVQGIEKELMARDSKYSPEISAPLLEDLGHLDLKLGSYERAQEVFQRAVQLREQLRIPQNWLVTFLAGGMRAWMKFDAELVMMSGPNALALMKDLNGLGTAFLGEANLDAASRSFGLSCSISHYPTEGQSRYLAECYNNLGTLAERRGQNARARFLFSIALHYFQSTPGKDNPDIREIPNNLAAILQAKGVYAGAKVRPPGSVR